MGRKKKLRKEEIAEDWCFVCKDGGSLRICDYKDCLKAYHPDCVDKDDSLLETEAKWTCSWHFCFECDKAPKFYCLCCPAATCGHCLCDAEFALVKGNKGLCNYCLELALLIEEKKDIDSDGCKIDFSAPDTSEFLFYEYWQIIKEKESLTSEHVISAYNLLKSGKNYSCASDADEYDEGEEDIDDEDKSRTRKRKKLKRKVCVTKKKVKSRTKEFIGWGSRPLLEFLASIGKDTTQELSQQAVTSIINEYCKENKLFHPERKRKIICDARLRALFGRKSVDKNSIYKHLTAHIAENLDNSDDDFGCSSENEDEDDLVVYKMQPQSNLVIKSRVNEVIVDVRKSCFAAIVPKNIKLVYLRKSLVEELSKQLENFDDKIIGNFVRVKSDPNDYMQKNSHQLVQVTGVKKTPNTSSEILLQVSNVINEVPICKLSDDDFSEEECEDLHQKVKNGLLKRLTVLQIMLQQQQLQDGVHHLLTENEWALKVELRQKARSLHEDITKHWIARELVLLQKRIDKANEKGWRRELYELMDRLLLLQKPSEQSRLLSEIPEVIADIAEHEPDFEDSMKEDEKVNNGELPELLSRRRTRNHPCNSSNGFSRCLHDSTNVAAIVTKGETQTIATSDQENSGGSQNEATTPASPKQPGGGESLNSAADCLPADGSSYTKTRGGEESEDVAQGNGSCSGNNGHEHVLVDEANEFEVVVEDKQKPEKAMKEMQESKDLEKMQVNLSL